MKKLFFSHIPKTAGKTIEEIINGYILKNKKMDSIGEKYFRDLKKDPKFKNYYEYFLKKKYLDLLINYQNKTHWNINIWHIPLSYWNNKILMEYKKRYIIFCVIRNPYERVVSDFKYWIKFYKNIQKGRLNLYFMNLIKEIKYIYDNDFSLTSKNLNRMVKKLYSSKKYKYVLDGHLIPQYEFIYSLHEGNLIKIPDVILRFENLQKEFNEFKNFLGLSISNSKIVNIHKNPTNSNLNIHSLSDESKKIIYKYYKLNLNIFYSKI